MSDEDLTLHTRGELLYSDRSILDAPRPFPNKKNLLGGLALWGIGLFGLVFISYKYTQAYNKIKEKDSILELRQIQINGLESKLLERHRINRHYEDHDYPVLSISSSYVSSAQMVDCHNNEKGCNEMLRQNLIICIPSGRDGSSRICYLR